jgi:hypothetical protein
VARVLVQVDGWGTLERVCVLDIFDARYAAGSRVDQSLVKVNHVVRANVAQETADLVVLDDVPNIVWHGDQKHSWRAQKHALNSDFGRGRRHIVEPLIEESHVGTRVAHKCGTHQHPLFVQAEVEDLFWTKRPALAVQLPSALNICVGRLRRRLELSDLGV